MSLFQTLARANNAAFTPLLNLPLVGPKLAGHFTPLHYPGRMSGRDIEVPVAYRRDGDFDAHAGHRPDYHALVLLSVPQLGHKGQWETSDC